MKSSHLADLMHSVLTAVREDLRPELTSSHAKHRADLIDMMLVRIATEIECSASESGEDERSIISPDDMAALHDHCPDHARRAELETYIASFAALERRRRNTIEIRLEEIATTAAPSVESTSELDTGEEVFTAYLQKKFPDKADTAVCAVTVIPGGRSKGTLLLDISDNNETRSIVIRRDLFSMPTGVSVAYEYPIIQKLWNTGFVVPEPLWMEEDTTVIGGTFVAFSRVPGQAMGTLYNTDASPAFARNFAATLARLHSVNIESTGLDCDLRWGKERHPVKAMVESFYQRYKEKVPPTPLLDTAFAWLFLHLDEISEQRCLTHGDASFHNAMGDGDKLHALLDWELSHAGDPAEDICYCKPLVEKIMPWSEFMQAYQNHGGGQISEQRMQFFSVWRSVMLAVQMGGAQRIYLNGTDRDLRIAAIGFNSFPKILNDLANDLASFTKT